MIILKLFNRNDMHLTIIFISVLVITHILMRSILVTHLMLSLVLVIFVWFLTRHEIYCDYYIYYDYYQQIQTQHKQGCPLLLGIKYQAASYNRQQVEDSANNAEVVDGGESA
jgi:hypothetical protein